MYVEAMKMQNPMRTVADGRVKAIHVADGATVEEEDILIELEPIS